MTMPFLKTSESLFAKAESPAGTSADPLDKANTYASPTLTNVRIRNLEVTVDPEKDNEDSKYLTGDLTGDESIIGKIPSSIKFDIKGAPAEWNSTTPAAQTHTNNYTEYLKNCGLTEVIIDDGVTSDANYTYPKQYLYFPNSSAISNTVTYTHVSKDETDTGIATELIGTMSNLTISAESAGSPFKFMFEGKASTAEGADGVWEISTANMANLDFDDANVMDTVASKFLNTTITLTNLNTAQSVTVCSAMVSLNSGNEINYIECQQSKSGYQSAFVTAMKPRLVIKPQLKQLGDFEYWNGLTEQDKYSIDIKVDYDNANGIFPHRIYVPNAQLLNVPRTDENGIVHQELTFRPLRNSEKVLPPSLQYIDQTTGNPVAWSVTGSALDGKEQEAMWYYILGEEEVTD